MGYKKLAIPVVIILVLLLISGWFYWFELRPSKIRQECSWVKHTDESIPAKPAMSEEELRAKSIIEDCKNPEGIFRDCKGPGYTSIFCGSFEEECERKNKRIIEEYKTARPTVPTKDWYSKSPEKQYDFCIKSKGLTR